MNWTRRDFVKTGIGAGVALGVGLPNLGFAPKDLIKKKIPKADRQVPVVGIGTRNYRVDVSDAEAMSPLDKTLRTFIELGGEVVDTAPSYGNSEEVIGHILRGAEARDRVFLATKVDRQTVEEGAERLQNSFHLLDEDYIDLMQVHNLRGVEVQLPVLREMKQDGRIGLIGITTSSRRQYERFVEVMQTQELDFIQVNYSLGDRGAEEAILPLAEERGVAVLVNLPFGRGRLFRRVGDREVPDWAGELGIETWGQFFLKYVVSHPAITAAIPGTTKDYHATDNIGAARGELLDAETRARMEAFYDALPEPEGER